MRRRYLFGKGVPISHSDLPDAIYSWCSSILSKSHDSINAFLEKRAHTPTHKIVHAILNCIPYDFQPAEETPVFNKTYKNLHYLAYIHHIRFIPCQALFLPNQTPKTCGNSRALPASLSLLKQFVCPPPAPSHKLSVR